MKLRIAATILISSTTVGIAADFTPIPAVKMAQNNQAPCISNCQTSFDICARLRVNSGIARNCESERDTSLSAIAGAVAADKAMNNAMSAIGP